MRTLLLLALSACTPDPPPQETWPITGTVLEVEATQVLMDHQAVGDLMPAMTMPIPATPEVLAGLQAGDRVRGTIRMTDLGVELIAARVLDRAPQTQAAKALALGEVLPALQAPATGGGLVKIGADQGAPTILAFLSAGCDDAPCTALREVLQALEPALVDRGRIVAVTLTPETDTLPGLEARVRELGLDRRVWRFARLERVSLDRLLQTAGVPEGAEGVRAPYAVALTAEGALTLATDGADWDSAATLDAMGLADSSPQDPAPAP